MAQNPNSKYPAGTNAPDANYPYGSARNIAVPGDGTGTPWEEGNTNDIYGFQQALLSSAGITPSGSPDTALVSQYHIAMRATAGFPGLIVPMALNVDPATAGIRVLLLDGSGILRANYSELDANVYIGDANNSDLNADAFFHADDAAGTIRNTAGAYLILADARGEFLRGIGGQDPDTSRYPGSEQGDSFGRHFHQMENNAGTKSYHEVEFSGLSKGTGRTLLSTFETGDTEPIGYAQQQIYIDKVTSLPITDETRPTNITVNWGIWY
jgi:hypothetical protein